MRHVFIIGCKGLPANYGGFETFVEQLTGHRVSPDVQYHVACAVESKPSQQDFINNNAHCHRIQWRPLGSARAIFYDLDALSWAIGYARDNHVKQPIFYVLACRIGPFIHHYLKRIHRLGGLLFVNPDGHEWKRAKWNAPTRKYWKISERLMVKHADLLVCDSTTIEQYIHREYKVYKPKTIFIAYGANLHDEETEQTRKTLESWFSRHHVSDRNYYLIVGRFVPENNYETMIREFMASHTHKDLVIITKAEGAFFVSLQNTTGFKADSRIKFVGTVYDQSLLQSIRDHAFAYLHGHEAGGTNPSLLEALASTQLNMLLNIGFNREVAQDAALYWDKTIGSLSQLIDAAESYTTKDLQRYNKAAKDRIRTTYSWDSIVAKYEHLFLAADGKEC
ncbi:glycosyl transferase [Bifidobacterium aemilianum]|uniref:Glycosyl transferase n=1 Tax=Bifidobacterium aemilianum TaxID=2493120 RepID=A0A366K8H7_9BIFI|nr:DUF1972 domain-containing protein [Bifidobacterium aemilianum]RBP97468.1 glycosyl transferase [Bifidobacterium aemilianum]